MAARDTDMPLMMRSSRRFLQAVIESITIFPSSDMYLAQRFKYMACWLPTTWDMTSFSGSKVAAVKLGRYDSSALGVIETDGDLYPPRAY